MQPKCAILGKNLKNAPLSEILNTPLHLLVLLAAHYHN